MVGFLINISVNLIFNALCLYAVVTYVDGVIYTGGWWFFVIGGFSMGILNAIVKPIIKIISLPLIFLSGGLFLIVINGALLWLLQYFLSVAAFKDVAITFPNLGAYAIGALVFGLVNFITNLIK